MSSTHPYKNLPEKQFWAPAVGSRNMFDIDGLWDPKFPIGPQDKVVTFGSCFAQHIGLALKERGFNWYKTEKGPKQLSAENLRLFNYDLFSARTGNIYTVSLLNQWVEWATGAVPISEEIWEENGRYIDPFRPTIEPNGFASREELVHSRQHAVQAFHQAISTADVFVFTLGLTESWHNSRTGCDYPLCPGTATGTFNGEEHQFTAQMFPFIYKTLKKTIQKIRREQPYIRFLLTVSPVPLTATNTGKHVLLATTESKSILRAVAGQLADTQDNVDYFPSYEIINSSPYRGTFFESNLRTVNHSGVEHVMNTFFRALAAKYPNQVPAPAAATDTARAERIEKKRLKKRRSDAVCEEELLGAFSK